MYLIYNYYDYHHHRYSISTPFSPLLLPTPVISFEPYLILTSHPLSLTPLSSHRLPPSPLTLNPPSDSVNVTFIDRKQCSHSIRGKIGDNVLYLAKRYGIELEGLPCTISLSLSLSLSLSVCVYQLVEFPFYVH